eukprot:gene5211-18439_t
MQPPQPSASAASAAMCPSTHSFSSVNNPLAFSFAAPAIISISIIIINVPLDPPLIICNDPLAFSSAAPAIISIITNVPLDPPLLIPSYDPLTFFIAAPTICDNLIGSSVMASLACAPGSARVNTCSGLMSPATVHQAVQASRLMVERRQAPWVAVSVCGVARSPVAWAGHERGSVLWGGATHNSIPCSSEASNYTVLILPGGDVCTFQAFSGYDVKLPAAKAGGVCSTTPMTS